jgi:hypothetical protein
MGAYLPLHPPVPHSAGTNWIDKVGGLPGPIEAIYRVLVSRGMDKSEAAPTAISQAEKQCATGLAAGGHIKLGVEAHATICKAVADLKAKGAASKATTAAHTSNLTSGVIDMAVMDKQTRDQLPSSAFALPAIRQYPIQDLVHARIALAMVKANGTPGQITAVRAAVRKRYPQVTVSDMANPAAFDQETVERVRAHKRALQATLTGSRP